MGTGASGQASTYCAISSLVTYRSVPLCVWGCGAIDQSRIGGTFLQSKNLRKRKDESRRMVRNADSTSKAVGSTQVRNDIKG